MLAGALALSGCLYPVAGDTKEDHPGRPWIGVGIGASNVEADCSCPERFYGGFAFEYKLQAGVSLSPHYAVDVEHMGAAVLLADEYNDANLDAAVFMFRPVPSFGIRAGVGDGTYALGHSELLVPHRPAGLLGFEWRPRAGHGGDWIASELDLFRSLRGSGVGGDATRRFWVNGVQAATTLRVPLGG